MRSLFFVLTLIPFSLFCQSPLYKFRDLDLGETIPQNINNSRTAAIIQIPTVKRSSLEEGDWKEFSDQAHRYLYKMGIDVVFYINYQDLNSGNSTRNFYQSILQKRAIDNIIFITKSDAGFELIVAPYSKKADIVTNNTKVYHRTAESLNSLLLNFGRDVKRMNLTVQNFLIPEKPTFLDALTIVQNSNLKNYPGQIRRSKLAVEKFQKLEVPQGASDQLLKTLTEYNEQIDQMNAELEERLKELPYDIEFIDYMTDENLLRRRYQFVLRNVTASAESIKAMLKYKDQSSSAGYVSVIPVMPDNTTIKTFSRKSLVHKFYIRQNIAKNVYVGEWDADETWQSALDNYIGNMLQYFNAGN